MKGPGDPRAGAAPGPARSPRPGAAPSDGCCVFLCVCAARVSLCVCLWVRRGVWGVCSSFEAPVCEILRSRSGRRGWGGEPRCALWCFVDLYLMAERRDAFLSFTLTLLLFWRVMCLHRSVKSQLQLNQVTTEEGGAAAQAVHVIHKFIWPGILEKNEKTRKRDNFRNHGKFLLEGPEGRIQGRV